MTCSPLRGLRPTRGGRRLMEKLPKAADLDAVAAREGVAHRVEDGLDGKLGVALGQLAKAFSTATRSERVMTERL